MLYLGQRRVEITELRIRARVGLIHKEEYRIGAA